MSFGVALVGLDHWYTAFAFAESAAASTVAPLVVVSEFDRERLNYLSSKYPNVLATTDAGSAIHAPGVELVAVCAATDQAVPICKAALQAGKHVLSVKPPARSLAELDDVLAVARQSGTFYGSFEGMQRLHPRAQILRDLLTQDAIGTALSFHQVGHGSLPAPWPGESGDSWWLHQSQVPGGAWIDHAIYAVDLARFVFNGEVDFATGVIENRVHKHLEVEDYGAALMRLQPTNGNPGVTLHIEDTWAAQPGGGTSRYQIIGTHGTIHWEGSDWVVKRGKDETRHPVPSGPSFGLDELAQRLQTGQTPPFGMDDARANLAACLQVYDAARR
jgi:predicted dehydrogenase